jgi:hypothetical protein
MAQDTRPLDRTADLWHTAEKVMATYRLYAEELAAGAACRKWGHPVRLPAAHAPREAPKG